MQATRLFVLAILSVTLSGCFVSSEPFITAGNADHPWANLRAQEFGWEDGAWKPKGRVVLRREGSFYQIEDQESHDVSRFLVKRIDDHNYIGQSQDMSGSGDANYTYALLVADGKSIYEYSFHDQSERCQVAGIDTAGLKLKPYEGGCGVPSLAVLTQIFAALQKSQPQYEVKYEIEP